MILWRCPGMSGWFQKFHDLIEIETETIFLGQEIFHFIVLPYAFLIEHFPFFELGPSQAWSS